MRSLNYLILIVTAVFLNACQYSGVKTNDPEMPSNVYLQGRDTTAGVILCHGRGHHPEWYVVDPLRKGINQQLGYHTLSIQMPTDDVGWREYRSLFPDAHKRIAAAVRYLKEVKKVEKIYLMGHSMGGRMTTSFLASHPDSGIAGFIGVGLVNNGGAPLDSNINLRQVKIPVLDVYGDGANGRDARHAGERADMAGKNYQQILISGADHLFTGQEAEMVTAVVSWLKKN